MADTKPLEVKGKIKSIKDYEDEIQDDEGNSQTITTRRVITIGKYFGKSAIAAWLNAFESPNDREDLMYLKPGMSVKITGYTNAGGWNNATGIEIIQDVHDDQEDEESDNDGPTHYCDKDAQIARSVAIKEANSWATAMLINSKEVTKKDVLTMAKEYAHFILTGE